MPYLMTVTAGVVLAGVAAFGAASGVDVYSSEVGGS